MAWAIPLNSKTRVDKAGWELVQTDEVFAYESALSVINNWRASHNYPLNIMQDGLRKRARKVDDSCIVAQRIKRLRSITDKLHRFPSMRTSMMQDIGGCRAVVASVEHVRKLVENYKRSDIRHILHQEDDYIHCPQPTGYRGVHLVYKYHSDKKATYNGMKIEVQIRSSLQHSWATAVETVGTFTGQALKSSQGTDMWLRFFQLMGSAIAEMEQTNLVANTPVSSDDLKKELRRYVKDLNIGVLLSSYGAAIQGIHGTSKVTDSQYYLLTLDPEARSIKVEKFSRSQLAQATDSYNLVEQQIKGTPKNAVLVSVDSLELLRKAYPNYFLDMAKFISLVSEATA